MSRYKLRTLLIVLALGPMVLAWGWGRYNHWHREREMPSEMDAVLRAGPAPTLNPFLWDMQSPPKPAE